jgi:hypothetical protein
MNFVSQLSVVSGKGKLVLRTVKDKYRRNNTKLRGVVTNFQPEPLLINNSYSNSKLPQNSEVEIQALE